MTSPDTRGAAEALEPGDRFRLYISLARQYKAETGTERPMSGDIIRWQHAKIAALEDRATTAERAMAEAIAAEREACAKIAASFEGQDWETWDHMTIARAIRARARSTGERGNV